MRADPPEALRVIGHAIIILRWLTQGAGRRGRRKTTLIPYNPALRPRNRGRRTGRRLERGPQRARATPLEALLLAERAALLSGRDDDFTMILTIGYTGMRCSETIGLDATTSARPRSASNGSSAN